MSCFRCAVELVGGTVWNDEQITLRQCHRFFGACNLNQAVAAMGKMKPCNIFEFRNLDAPGRGQRRAEIEGSAHGEIGEDVTEKVEHGKRIEVYLLLYRTLNDLHNNPHDLTCLIAPSHCIQEL